MAEPHSILARVAEGLRRRDWGAIGIEFLIVFVGVLLGTQVSNWNDERKERAEVAALLDRLKPDIRRGLIESPVLARYYESRIALAEKAERLMVDGGDDLGLVTSARLTGSYAQVVDFDRDTYAMKIGADTVSHIPDQKLRTAFADLIALQNDAYVRFQYIDTEFRRLVLRLYPADIAYTISKACNLSGDNEATAAKLRQVSTTDCNVALPPGEVTRLAALLRAGPDALGLLREHINRLRTTNGRIGDFEKANRDVLEAMGEGKQPRSN